MQATRTYLELTSPRDFRPAFGDFTAVTVAREPRPTPDLYRACYRTVGEAYHWRDRWDWSDAEIRRHLADPAISPSQVLQIQPFAENFCTYPARSPTE